MRIAILGTRGIPNNYGGFEQFAGYLAVGLIKKGHDVIVYNSHNHPYQESSWNGVSIIHKNDPEHKWGTVGQFAYDLNCILDVRKRGCDVILQLGYTSCSVWGSLLPKTPVIFTNMDGLEWKRTKFNNYVKRFLRLAERLAIKYSDQLISDSVGIQKYFKTKHNKDSIYIPYGAELFTNPNKEILGLYHLKEFQYDMLTARLVTENSIEVILDGVVQAGIERPFLVVGNYKTRYGNYLKNKYKDIAKIQFVGGIYEAEKLNNLRYYSNLYFHGHTVGGTNPSLLEAMACRCLISAHDNPFNKHVLKEHAYYFKTKDDIAAQLKNHQKNHTGSTRFIDNNLLKIEIQYNWEKIINQYESAFIKKKYGKVPTVRIKKIISEI